MDSDDIAELLNENDNDDGEEVQLTSAEVIEMMEEAWLNEKFAPDILPNKIEIVDCLLEQIKHMDENLKTIQHSDFKKSLHQLEIDRIRYLITSYLRKRLEKIEAYVFSILKEEEERAEIGEDSYLTEAELKFAKNYKQSLEQHYDDVVSFYPTIPIDDWKNQPIKPNRHGFVFLKSKNNVEGVVIDDGREEDGDVVDLLPGSQMVISYNSVSDLVKKGDVQLV